jgi:hypothetical protein
VVDDLTLEWREFTDFQTNRMELFRPLFDMPFFNTTWNDFYVSQYGALVPSRYAVPPCLATDWNGFPSLFNG